MRTSATLLASGLYLFAMSAVLVPAQAVPDEPVERPDRAPVRQAPAKKSLAVGHGGAVASVDAEATAIGIEVLRRGGNAMDAAVATAAALGVTEPYSDGIGGGGYLMHYDARTRSITTFDGRETAPAGVTPQSFTNPATGSPYTFTPDLVTSGVSVGVPGTPMLWRDALDRFGTRSLASSLEPAADLAERGFVVDETFRNQTLDNKAPRASLRNTATVTAEPAYIKRYGRQLTRLGYTMQPAGDGLTSTSEIGAVTAIEFGPGTLRFVAAEPTRRGGGSAEVLRTRPS